MSDHLPREVREGLAAAKRGPSRLHAGIRIEADGASFPVLRRWKSGFALEAGVAPGLRGLVDLYDGTDHIGQCLIVAAGEDEAERRFEFKRGPTADVPPRDWAPEPDCDAL